jgi:hypothetical protein
MRRRHVGWFAGAVLAAAGCPAAASADLTAPTLNPQQFSHPTQVQNTWFPLAPGTEYVYRGQADRDGLGLLPARVVFTVTDVTKVVDGVRSLVVWDRDFSDGALVEDEIHFFAQQDNGDVWSLGEYPEEVEQGRVVGAPTTWLSGVEGAHAGIHVQGTPQVGSAPYVQGLAPAVGFFNAARVSAIGQRTCVPLACYDNVLVTDEFAPDEPGNGGSRKSYAPGVGNVRVEPGGDPDLESLELTSFRRLGQATRARANATALKLDTHARKVARRVYGSSAYAELPARAAR